MADVDDEIAERVMRIVAEESGWNPLAITWDSEIERDLGCTGDRAREIMLRLERECGVDMRGVDFDRYFGNEASSGWPLVVAAVVALPASVLAMNLIGLTVRTAGIESSAVLASSGFFLGVYVAICAGIAVFTKLQIARRRNNRIPVTVRDLIDAARVRRWILSSSFRSH